MSEIILLRDAGNLLGEDWLKSILPKHFSLTLDSHSTGCQAKIHLQDASGQLLVWEGSVWYSNIYDFNDRNKTLGIQNDTQFARPLLEEFFRRVQSGYEERLALNEFNKQLSTEEKEKQRLETIQHFKTLLERP